MTMVRIEKSRNDGRYEGPFQTKPVSGKNDGDIVEPLVYIKKNGAFYATDIVEECNKENKGCENSYSPLIVHNYLPWFKENLAYA
jgi:hypothetical protein